MRQEQSSQTESVSIIEHAGEGEATQLEQRARILAERQEVARIPVMETEDQFLAFLEQQEEALQAAYEQFVNSTDEVLTLSYAAEWLLDNYYVVQRAERQVGEDLPQTYYRELPKLAGEGPLQGFPRVYELARVVSMEEQFALEPERIRRFLESYQQVESLTMGELWAVPIMLRVVLLAALTQAAVRLTDLEEEVFSPQKAFRLDYGLDDGDVVAACIPSLHVLANLDWKDFFESVSLVEQSLQRDPARLYGRMDFDTRDRYRKVVEELAWSSDSPESDVARQAAAMAESAYLNRARGELDGGEWAGLRLPRSAHVGYYLVGAGREELESRLDFQPSGWRGLQRWLLDHPTFVYLSGIGLVTLVTLLLAVGYAAGAGGSGWQVALAFLVALVPTLSIGVSLTNWLVTQTVRPRVLPKLDFSEGIPDLCRTMVVVPSMLTSEEEVQSLVSQLERHFLSNSDPNLSYALLTDWADAPREEMPEDERLLEEAQEAIARLNEQYGGQPFYLLHRRRLWNAEEEAWIGWERKRGKLHEFNRLLRGAEDTSFSVQQGALERFSQIRYVITLDADTILPRESAARLVGALAHPLNQAQFNAEGEVVAGYTVLQPRTEIKPTSASQSLFTRIFAGDAGLDLYTLAVSDVYQDLFGEGIFVGKGIYDVDAFERSLQGRVPENSLLSHDLFEGIHGRAGLATDVILYEDYPPHYLIQTRRSHRWVRGDWQLLPWLLPIVPTAEGWKRSRLDPIDWWKIVDNLRRSLWSPVLLLLFVAGWTFLPGSPLIWTLLGLLSPGVNAVTSAANVLVAGIVSGSFAGTIRPLRDSLIRWFLFLVFLPYEAVLNVDAILTTLGRLFLTRRHLLQWTTAAHSVRLFGEEASPDVTWRQMLPSLLLSLALALIVLLLRPFSLLVAAPLLLLWALSPQIAYWISEPDIIQPTELSVQEQQQLRRLARRTWFFFEHFVGPEDNWLPPDHFQESPKGVVAHRTSPTNVGLYLLSALSAYHFGYIGSLDLVLRLRSTLETMGRMERHRGHFLNWIDTRTLSPLPPRYVSAVDSGNLAASLIALRQACLTLPEQPVLRWERWQALLDTLAIMDELLSAIPDVSDGAVTALQKVLQELREQVLAARDEPERWPSLFIEVDEKRRPEVDRRMLALLEAETAAVDTATVRSWRMPVEGMHLHLGGMRREIEMLLPWLLAIPAAPALFAEPQLPEAVQAAWQALLEQLPANPRLLEVPPVCTDGEAALERLQEALIQALPASDEVEAAQEWCERFSHELASARMISESLVVGYQDVASQMEGYVEAMDFGFLFNAKRQVFHIGYNVDAGKLDENYYDLLASEARITSLIAIAKGDVPVSHWLHLARPVTEVQSGRTLLSWSGTMFEYAMPPLLLRSYRGTLLHSSVRTAVEYQIWYGKQKELPWGISESGFYAFDAARNYQYRAFGVPGLGFKRGLGDDLVISPYSTLLALGFDPQAVMENLETLREQEMTGQYGLYEAVDYTPSRLRRGARKAIVYSYMAHHQGMMMASMINFLDQERLVEYFHADARIQSVDLLLQEQVPTDLPLERPHEDRVPDVRPATASTALHPWTVPLNTPFPSVHFLTNGRYRLLISNAGAGYSRWQDDALTRWRPDVTQDDWGQWLYLQDEESGALWSAGLQPTGVWPQGGAAQGEVRFYPHMAEFQRRDNGIILDMEVTVAPEDDVEIRRIRLNNDEGRERQLRLTSYAEVVLAEQGADERHPAFVKLFVESEYLPELNALLFRRRPRAASETTRFLLHMLVPEEGHEPTGAYESDRQHFLGRGRTARQPAALLGDEWLGGHEGATLDPIMSLGQRVEMEGHGGAQLAYITLAAETREEALELAARYRSWPTIERSFSQAQTSAERALRRLELGTPLLERVQQLLSLLIYPYEALRVDAGTLAANERGQPALWSFGISGDNPILLLRMHEEAEGKLLRQLLKAHTYWRDQELEIDLVILNQQETNYGQALQAFIHRVINRSDSDDWLNKRGGIFVLRADQMETADRRLLESAARVILNGAAGPLDEQLAGIYQLPTRLPAFVASLEPEGLQAVAPVSRPEELLFDNGYGGFSAGEEGSPGKEYLIYLEPGDMTPAPWINVVANPEFGFLVSETGAGYSWAINSGENRLTPWRNDAVTDMPSEALFLRDEETAEVWSPTPQPAPADAPYLTRHGAGYTIFEHNSHGLKQRLRLFVAPDDPVKIVALTLENGRPRQRRLTATFYAPLVLGVHRYGSEQYLVPEYSDEHHALLARNPYNVEFAERVAFVASSKPPHGLTADRTEFLGRYGSLRFPAAMGRIGLESRVEPGSDPCATLQMHVELGPGESETLYFLLGQGADREESLQLLARYQQPEVVERAWQGARQQWDDILGAVQVETPDLAMDLLLNRWLLYQALSCRIWGRSALYQSSGAYGFRDQLQDVMSLLFSRPELAREHILRAARHQFEAGDVLHWWHPPSGRGVRTRIKDDLLWLPFVTAHYVAYTGDEGILQEQLPFRSGEPLKEDEEERYGYYPLTEGTASLYEHCRRAIARGTTAGRHGLPLMGGGDWNDGMNRVGIEGKGESVWLGWFLHATLARFADLCGNIGEAEQAEVYRERATALQQALEVGGWDGAWYRRAYYDDGFPLGSTLNKECQIDAIAQSWGVLSEAADQERARQAMEAVEERLISYEERLLRLFTPPFDKTERDPGYIKGYLPGIRENGGQYTHAGLWTIWAFAAMGEGEKAASLFRLTNPIYRARTEEMAQVYKVEPYVIVADVYSVEPHVGEGGWTWYTGSSGWMYRLGVEAILGLRRDGDSIWLEPQMPPAWPGFRLTYRHGDTRYEIEVDNSSGSGQGVRCVALDGEPLPTKRIPLLNDGQLHQVRVELGLTAEQEGQPED